MQKKALALAIAGAMVPVATQAVSFKISGQVNRALRFSDDGHGSEVEHVDNGNSRTRFRFVGSEKFGSMKAGIYIEIGMASNRTTFQASKAADTANSRGTADGPDSFSGTGNDIRHSALWFSGSWGKLTMGHTFDTYEGLAGKDLSGIGLHLHPSVGATDIGNVRFRTTAGGIASTGGLQSFNSLDGGRIDLLRYDSPALGPFKVAIYSAQNEEWGASAWLNTKFAGGKFAAQIGYQDEDNRSGFQQMGGSASFLFSQGTSISAGYSQRDFTTANRDDAELWMVRLGHKWGNNAIGIAYGNWDAQHLAGTTAFQNGSDGEMYGIAFHHNIPKPGVELYASYTNWDLDLPNTQTEDVDVAMVGTRIKFK